MMKKTFKIIIIFPFFILNFFSLGFSQDETITVTTYYPAPYGVYSILRLNPLNPAILPPCQPGEMYFRLSAPNRIYLCVASPNDWREIPVSIDIPPQYWAPSGNKIYNTNDPDLVGIGFMFNLLYANPPAKFTAGRAYGWDRVSESFGFSTPRCLCDPLDDDNVNCPSPFWLLEQYIPDCYDHFRVQRLDPVTGLPMVDGSGNPIMDDKSWLYHRRPMFIGTVMDVINGNSYFVGKVGVSMKTGPPAYDLEVIGSVKANNYRPQDTTSFGITKDLPGPPGPTILRNKDNTGSCTITIKNGLITGTDCT